MATVPNFLGKVLELPENLRYEPMEGLWVDVRPDGRLAVGMSEPAALMAGALRDIEPLVPSGTHVVQGQTVLLLLTARLKYIAAPVAGIIEFPADETAAAERVADNPYGSALFAFAPDNKGLEHLLSAADYAEQLKDSEGARNPEGRKGGVSPTCKAVYMGLGGQKLTKE